MPSPYLMLGLHGNADTLVIASPMVSSKRIVQGICSPSGPMSVELKPRSTPTLLSRVEAGQKLYEGDAGTTKGHGLPSTPYVTSSQSLHYFCAIIHETDTSGDPSHYQITDYCSRRAQLIPLYETGYG